MKPLVSDELWARLEPLLPPPKPRRLRYPGRRPIPPRKVLTGIIFVLKTGLDWDDLPAELGWGCGKTCRAYLRGWQRAGIWQRLHDILLAELHGADRLDWSRALVDSALLKSPLGGEATGPNPTDRRKLGSKHHLISDAQGIPLATKLSKANAPDITQLVALVDAIPAVRGKRGRPRRRPDSVQGDRAYDSDPHRAQRRRRHIKPVLGRRRTGHGSHLGVYRWFIERTLSWLHQFGRLRLRHDRLPELQRAFLSLACSLICLRFVLKPG
jgi:transposase